MFIIQKLPWLKGYKLFHTVLSVPDSLVVTCSERAELLAVLCVILSCDFGTLPYGVLDQVWYLIVLIPDLCILLTLNMKTVLKPWELFESVTITYIET